MDSIDGIPEDAPLIRLCRIKKRDDFNGYGFNLHAEKSKPGQFIGTVDDGSPAQIAGLKEGDRIIEVNDVNISHENHKQVVGRIKAVSNETKLLVVDKETEEYYRNKEIVIRGNLGTVSFTSSEDGRKNDTTNHMVENGSCNSSRQNSSIVKGRKVTETIDEDDGIDDINYAMQQDQVDSVDNRFARQLSEGNPPPLPESPPPIDDGENYKQIPCDRHSLGGSSDDKVGKTFFNFFYYHPSYFLIASNYILANTIINT